jgi:diaminopimelate decarboxylase
MDHFQLRDGSLFAEDVPLALIAEQVGTPVYIYSQATLTRHARVFREALSGLNDPLIAFAVKANPNLAVLKILANEGFGADVVSGGELTRALSAGMKPQDIVFSGVGKTHAELLQALEAEIGQFNIESEEEGYELATIASGCRGTECFQLGNLDPRAKSKRGRYRAPPSCTAIRALRSSTRENTHFVPPISEKLHVLCARSPTKLR